MPVQFGPHRWTASGIMELAIIVSMAPAAKPCTPTSTPSLRTLLRAKPTPAPMPVMIMIELHMLMIRSFLQPYLYMCIEDASASGKLERKRPRMSVYGMMSFRLKSAVWESSSRMRSCVWKPITTLSGIPSSRIPMNTASGAVPAVAPDARQEVSTGAVSASVSMPAMLTALSAFFSLNRCPAPEMPESSPDEELLAIAEPAWELNSMLVGSIIV
mmetsp:Transcript_4622/g.11873  ORF Transcript_4622/g.11873 Transcript_4622/m.11873 type:complete len:215 (-) Transcript_4622:1594-2238(-)